MNRPEILSDYAQRYAMQEGVELSATKFGSWLIAASTISFVRDNEFTYGELSDALGNRPGVMPYYVDRDRKVV